jgi:hypothetical protein
MQIYTMVLACILVSRFDTRHVSGKTDYVGGTKLAKELAAPAEPVRGEKVAEEEVA